MTGIPAGELRHRVTIQRDTPQSGAAPQKGQYKPTYATFGGPHWALVEEPTGFESANAEQIIGVNQYKVVMRPAVYSPQLTDRIVWGDVVLEIVSWSVDPFKARLTIVVKQKVK